MGQRGAIIGTTPFKVMVEFDKNGNIVLTSSSSKIIMITLYQNPTFKIIGLFKNDFMIIVIMIFLSSFFFTIK